MDAESLNGFLCYGMWLCVVMMVLSPALRWRRLGPTAVWMGLAFGAMALLMNSLVNGLGDGVVIASGVLLVVLLAADGLSRAARKKP